MDAFVLYTRAKLCNPTSSYSLITIINSVSEYILCYILQNDHPDKLHLLLPHSTSESFISLLVVALPLHSFGRPLWHYWWWEIEKYKGELVFSDMMFVSVFLEIHRSIQELLNGTHGW